MKTFARLFFYIGIAAAIYAFLFPESLNGVSVSRSPAPTVELPEQPVSKPESAEPAVVASVDVNVNGVPYPFSIRSLDEQYVRSEARAFCLSHSAALSLAPESLDTYCTEVVVKAIYDKARGSSTPAASSDNTNTNSKSEHAASNNNNNNENDNRNVPVSYITHDPATTVFKVSIPVTDGNTYTIGFDAMLHDPYQVADRFCRENAGNLKLETEQHIIQGCVPSVGKFIAEQLESTGFVRPTPNSEESANTAQEA